MKPKIGPRCGLTVRVSFIRPHFDLKLFSKFKEANGLISGRSDLARLVVHDTFTSQSTNSTTDLPRYLSSFHPFFSAMEEKEPPSQSPPTAHPDVHHHHHHHLSPSNTCINCGGPTAYPTPPPPSSNPTYIPIRFPAVNLPMNPTNTKEAIIRTPVPQSQRVAPLEPPYNFQTPIKIISNQDDIVRLHSSSALANFLGFVVSLSESIKSHKLSDPCHVSSAVSTIVDVIEKLITFVDEIPPAPQAARYGNVAYRTWHDRMSSDAESFMLMLLPADLRNAAVELVPYFTDSFGNSSRIDYGKCFNRFY